MTADNALLAYSRRHYGMDHDRYEWAMLAQRPMPRWPQGKTLALWVNVSLQFFPLNPQRTPVSVPGNMTMPYPDLRHFTLRDYGNRVGIYRLLQAFDRYGIVPTFAVNAQVAERYPYLFDAIVERGNEIIGHSWNMDTAHAGGLAESDEALLIARSLDTLERRSGRAIAGWLSPGKLESENTPDLLREAGIEYFCDWVNDDMPYAFRTRHGELWTMPLSSELEDRFVIQENLHAESSWAQQVRDAHDFLLEEGQRHGARILSLSLHPWVIGQPHRIKHLEALLEYLTSSPNVWCASAAGILGAYRARLTSPPAP